MLGGYVAVVDRESLHNGIAPPVPLRFQKEDSNVRLVSDDSLTILMKNAVNRTLSDWLEAKIGAETVETADPRSFKPIETKEAFERCAIGAQRYHKRSHPLNIKAIEPPAPPQEVMENVVDGSNEEADEKTSKS